MNLLETIIVVLIFGAFSVLIPMGLSYLIIKIYYYIKDRIFSEEDFNKNLKYPEHDSRNLKRAEFRAKHEPAVHQYDSEVDAWINRLLDMGVVNIYKMNTPFNDDPKEEEICRYVLETKKYICTYWHTNLFYGMADRGEIRNKNTYDIAIRWDNKSISKKTRYRLYQCEEAMREQYEDKEFPMLYNKDGVKAV